MKIDVLSLDLAFIVALADAPDGADASRLSVEPPTRLPGGSETWGAIAAVLGAVGANAAGNLIAAWIIAASPHASPQTSAHIEMAGPEGKVSITLEGIGKEQLDKVHIKTTGGSPSGIDLTFEKVAKPQLGGIMSKAVHHAHHKR